MRPDLNTWAMEMAIVTSKRSTCLRRAVGAVLLNARGHVLATGYNGKASGLPHCNEPTTYDRLRDQTARAWVSKPTYGNSCEGAQSTSGTNLDACEAIHAEQNALLQCKDVYDIDVCYVTVSPCITCTKLLLNTSCRLICFLAEYPHAEAAKRLWEGAGRSWLQIKL